jgi:hypothetical protein
LTRWALLYLKNEIIVLILPGPEFGFSEIYKKVYASQHLKFSKRLNDLQHYWRNYWKLSGLKPFINWNISAKRWSFIEFTKLTIGWIIRTWSQTPSLTGWKFDNMMGPIASNTPWEMWLRINVNLKGACKWLTCCTVHLYQLKQRVRMFFVLNLILLILWVIKMLTF